MTPIIIFSSQRQARECLRYWQRILNLQSWIIGVNLAYNGPLTAPDWGKSTIYRAIKVADIFIPIPEEGQENDFPETYCQEDILVHELLHVLLPTVEVRAHTTEGEYYTSDMHAKLEGLAKALLMAKYDITMDWFYNF